MDDFERWQQEGSGTSAETASPPSSFDFLGLLNRRKWYVILGLMLGVFVGYAVYAYSTPTYLSKAQVTVSRRGMLDSRQGGMINFEPIRKSDLETEAVKIAAPMLIYRAIQANRLEQLPSFAEHKSKPEDVQKLETLKYILKHLSVTKGDPNYEDADVLNILFTGPIPEDCPRVIQAVVDAYRDQLQGHFKNTSQETKNIFLNMKLQAERKVREIQNQYMMLLKQQGGMIVEGSATVANNSYLRSKEEFLEADRKVEELRRQLSIAQTKLADGEDRDTVLFYILSESPTINTQNMTRIDAEERKDVNSTLLDLQAARKALVQKLGPKHPDVRAVDEKIAIYKAKFPESAEGMDIEGGEPQVRPAIIGVVLDPPYVEDARNYQTLFNDGLVGGTFFEKNHVNPTVIQKASESPDSAKKAAPDYLDQRLKALSIAVQSAQLQRDEILARQQLEERRAMEINETVTALEFLREERENKQHELEVAMAKLSEMESVPENGYNVEQIMSPGKGLWTSPNLVLNLVLGGLAGTLLGFGLGFLIDRADRSFRSPEEIRRSLGVPVIGHIPVFFPRLEEDEETENMEGDIVGLDKMVCTYRDPDSLAAEAYRAVRTNLYFSTHGESHKVIQVTSPSSEDGKSTLASNLAVSLAQSGVKVLLMDADFRRPKVHQNFGIDKTNGLSNLIRGTIELPEAIHPSDIENLDLLPAGPRPRNPSELLTLPRFKELLATLRDRYDFVIIDSPPMLAVTDPGAIAARADGVLIALQIRRKVKPSATRAIELLTDLGANILGVVVNGVGWRRAYTYREGGNFGSGSRFYKYSADFRGPYVLGDPYAYSTPHTIEPANDGNGELLDANSFSDHSEAET
ncbi:polysaccharide biosynthesis tyrosine autokinase [bacterium]|nr:polysaccharide biosynthesis tyrosine autokinase [bacterium]